MNKQDRLLEAETRLFLNYNADGYVLALPRLPKGQHNAALSGDMIIGAGGFPDANRFTAMCCARFGSSRSVRV